MDLTTAQAQRHEKIIDQFIDWANSFTKESDYQISLTDAWPSECEVLSITDHTIGLLDQTETWVLSWGTGDDGGPSLLIAVFRKLSTEEEDAWQLNFMAQHFDTATQPIFGLPY